MAYSFQAKVAARGYHVYKYTTWEDAKIGDKVLIELETDEKSKEIDPYCCSIKAMVGLPQQLKTVGHIPREISRHVYFFLKEENGQIDGTVHSVDYRPSPIPAGGLEIPLVLNFKSSSYVTHMKMKEFVTLLYSYEFIAKETEPLSSDEEIDLLIQESSESDSELVNPNKKKKHHMIDESSASEDEDKDEENCREYELYDIVIEE